VQLILHVSIAKIVHHYFINNFYLDFKQQTLVAKRVAMAEIFKALGILSFFPNLVCCFFTIKASVMFDKASKNLILSFLKIHKFHPKVKILVLDPLKLAEHAQHFSPDRLKKSGYMIT
jgi:hypothetical protein